MPHIKINPSPAGAGADVMEEISRALEALQSEVGSVRAGISFRIRNSDAIGKNLKNIENRIELQGEDSLRLAECLRDAVTAYQRSERLVVAEYTGEDPEEKERSEKLREAMEKIADWLAENWDRLLLEMLLRANPAYSAYVAGKGMVELWKLLPDSASVLSGGVEGEGEFLGIKSEGSAGYSVLGMEKELEGYADFNKKVSAGAIASLAFHALKGEASGQWGIFGGSVEGEALAAEVRGEAKCALFDQKKFDPEISVKARARAEGLHGQAKGWIGNEELNVHVQGDGYVGVAKAEAKASLGLDGAEAKVEVGAAALSATGKAGFTIAGFDIDLYVTGEAGAVGAGAGFAATSDYIELEGKLAALLGLGLKLRISYD